MMKKLEYFLLSALTLGCGASGAENAPPFGAGGTAIGGASSGGAPGSGSNFSGGTSAGGGTTASGGASGGQATSSGGNSGTTVAELVTEDLWNQLFPNRNALFTYDAFVSASSTFSGFGTTGDVTTEKRDIAAFLANISHETTGGWADAPGGPYAWGLYYKEEVGCENGQCTGYAQGDAENVCVAGKTYHGRGPIQLSYCYNYGPAGRAIGVDLLAQPELVASDSVVSFKTGLWFWMHGKSGGATSPHQAIIGGQGFGETIRVINGIECSGGRPEAIADRVGFYEHFCEILGVDPGTGLTC